jgi:hypothetical protein
VGRTRVERHKPRMYLVIRTCNLRAAGRSPRTTIARGSAMIFVAVLGISALVGSFLLTLWLTAPGTPPANKAEPPSLAVEVLAAHLVPDERILRAAAKAAGLQPSDQLRGFIDEVARLDRAQVKIRGWAADLAGQGTPITVLVFANGRNTLGTQTKGSRPDVAQALNLSEAGASNVEFEGALSCAPGEPLFVVAVTQNNMYAALNQATRPLSCPS